MLSATGRALVTSPGITYDAGAPIAAERGDGRLSGGPQPGPSRVLKECRVEPLTEVQARAVGRLAAHADHGDAVDLAVVEGAARRTDVVVTSDPSDIERTASVVGIELRVVVV